MHLDDERVQRFLHGELAATAAAAVREHVTVCTECSALIAAADQQERQLFALLREVDHSPPRIEASMITARAERRNGGWSRRAAGVLFALAAAGAAYAIPGSPVPRLVSRVGELMDRPSDMAVASNQLVDKSGVAVTPSGRFAIVFAAPPSDGSARVSLTDGSDVVVRTGDSAAVFSSGVDRLAIENVSASATFEIEIPSTAPSVEIRIGTRRVFLKDASGVVTAGARDAEGRYLIPFSPPGADNN